MQKMQLISQESELLTIRNELINIELSVSTSSSNLVNPLEGFDVKQKLVDKVIDLVSSKSNSGGNLTQIFSQEINYLLNLARISKADKLLLKIAKSQNYPLVITLLESGLDPYYSNALLMRYAVYNCNLKLFKLLCEHGFNLRKMDTWLLSYSIEFSLPFVNVLIRSGSDINKTLAYTERFLSKPFILPRLVCFGINVEKLHASILKAYLSKVEAHALFTLLNIIESLPLQKINNICNGDANCEAIIYNLYTLNSSSISKNLFLNIFETMKIYKSSVSNKMNRALQIRKYYLITIVKLFIPKTEEAKQFTYIDVERLMEAQQTELFSLNLSSIKQNINISAYDVAKVVAADRLDILKIIENVYSKLDWDINAFYKLAIMYGSGKIVNYLLKTNITLCIPNFSIYNSLRYNHSHLIKYFLRKGVNLKFLKPTFLNVLAGSGSPRSFESIEYRINFSSFELTQLFIEACKKRNFNLANHLLKRFSNRIDLTSTSEQQLAVNACINCSEHKIMKFILDRTLQTDDVLYGILICNIIDESIHYKSSKQIKFIVKYICNNLIYHDREITLNETLIKCGPIKSTSVVKFLLACGANLTYKNNSYLKELCHWENVYILDYLINHHKFDLTTDGEMLLEYTCRCTGYLMAEYLLIRGVKGIKALVELYNGHFFEGAELLISKGVNINDALQTATSSGFYIASKHLIRAGADAHLKNENLLALACYEGELSIVKLLIDEGAIISSTSLYAACTNLQDSIDVIDYLTKRLNNPSLIDYELTAVSKKVGNFKIHNFLKMNFSERLKQ